MKSHVCIVIVRVQAPSGGPPGSNPGDSALCNLPCFNFAFSLCNVNLLPCHALVYFQPPTLESASVARKACRPSCPVTIRWRSSGFWSVYFSSMDAGPICACANFCDTSSTRTLPSLCAISGTGFSVDSPPRYISFLKVIIFPKGTERNSPSSRDSWPHVVWRLNFLAAQQQRMA